MFKKTKKSGDDEVEAAPVEKKVKKPSVAESGPSDEPPPIAVADRLSAARDAYERACAKHGGQSPEACAAAIEFVELEHQAAIEAGHKIGP
jgi:hypothetical protein